MPTDPGPLIGSGRAADIYDIGDGRVLRRNRNGESTALEAAAMRHLFTHDYPVPEIHDADGADLIMERVDGPTMLDSFARQPWKMRSWAATLADLHHLLLDVPVPDFDVLQRFGAPDVLIHGDLHPDNVMLTESGPVVIDWTNVGVGPRGAEVASTWILMATSELEGSLVVRTIQSTARSSFIAMFLKRAERDSALTWLPAVGEHRLRDPNLRPAEADNVRRLVAREADTHLTGS